MPYWGANVRFENCVIQVKIHGEDILPAPEELIEYVTNLQVRTVIKRLTVDKLAQFYADKIATAYLEHPDALWTTVDVLTSEGPTFGATRIIKEQNHAITQL